MPGRAAWPPGAPTSGEPAGRLRGGSARIQRVRRWPPAGPARSAVPAAYRPRSCAGFPRAAARSVAWTARIAVPVARRISGVLADQLAERRQSISAIGSYMSTVPSLRPKVSVPRLAASGPRGSSNTPGPGRVMPRPGRDIWSRAVDEVGGSDSDEVPVPSARAVPPETADANRVGLSRESPTGTPSVASDQARRLKTAALTASGRQVRPK